MVNQYAMMWYCIAFACMTLSILAIFVMIVAARSIVYAIQHLGQGSGDNKYEGWDVTARSIGTILAFIASVALFCGAYIAFYQGGIS